MYDTPPQPYRSDIDGLRALAVLSVVLYHFGLPLRGGFVGVDVFFVISGFLIGGILWREFDQTGTIDLRQFYIRRFRRLAPAFFVMALLTTAIGWAILLPFEFREYGKSLIAAMVYLSNVLFYRSAGYFDSASEEKPLLHTWSLAVEEQFYIFLPLALLILARLNRRWAMLVMLALIWAASLALCIVMTQSHPEAAFYLFPFRAWEMLSGVFLAIWGYETGRSWRGSVVASWLGLALVLFSIVAIPAGPQFPGILVILPVVGTLLLLANGTGQNPVNRMLCHPYAVFFGLISYSLYLWHWPVFTLSSYLRDGHANLLESLVWMVLSVGIAWVSWKFIEGPVRHARALPGGIVLGGTALASAVLLGLGGWLFVKDGLPDRYGPAARTQIAATGDFLQDWSRCTTAYPGPLLGLEVCPIGPEGPPQVMIWGDSHVRAFREGLDLAAQEAGTPGIILWRAGCAPLFGLRKVESAATQDQDIACTQANLQIKQALGRLDSLRDILLIGRWTYYANGTGIGLDATNTISLHDTEGPARTGQSQADLVAEKAALTVAELAQWGPRVTVLRQPPEIPQYDSRRAAREAAHAGWLLAPRPETQGIVPRAALQQRILPAEAPWLALQAEGKITVLDSWPRFCDDTNCQALFGDVGQYFDNNHVTNSAALRVRDLFAPVFAAR